MSTRPSLPRTALFAPSQHRDSVSNAPTAANRGPRPQTAVLGLLLVLGAAGCTRPGTLDGQSYHRGEIAYRIGSLPPDWSRVSAHGADLAFRHRDGGTIAVSASCGTANSDDVSLDVLTNHLLFGIPRQVEDPRVPFTLDGREALRTHVRGLVDGVAVDLDLVVMKKDGCTYDLQLLAGPTVFPARQLDFAPFVAAFATGPRR